ncbi:unnamed protein product [Blepharisma stoltei]|uniref:Uncharacterized protein n=1 Tax=Blepharisma stoltei TaxID=1481888 RepID=A0AAU9JCT3_9CILI|nr:unnamed protein product [Blepharisma stoltei]
MIKENIRILLSESELKNLFKIDHFRFWDKTDRFQNALKYDKKGQQIIKKCIFKWKIVLESYLNKKLIWIVSFLHSK